MYTCCILIIHIHFFRHTKCESTCDTLTSSATNQSDNTVSVAQGGTATPGATKQLLPPDRVLKRKYMWNIIKHNIRTSMNERTHFFIKIYLSHFILDKVMFLLCVRDKLETGTDCYIDPKLFFDHSSTSFSSWMCCSTVGHWGPQGPQSASWFSR